MLLPDNTQRILILGRTGSGKTHAGLWHLSLRNFDIPFCIIDTKLDHSAWAGIKNAKHINVADRKPLTSGLYIITAETQQFDNDLPQFLEKIWYQGNCGIMFDEVSDYGKMTEFIRILKQGRAKNIPCIILSQRPVMIDLSCYTEAEYFQIYQLTHDKDKEKVEAFMPMSPAEWNFTQNKKSIYYDVLNSEKTYLEPLPSRDFIINRLNSKLKLKLNFI